jgi:hypothetical protein
VETCCNSPVPGRNGTRNPTGKLDLLHIVTNHDHDGRDHGDTDGDDSDGAGEGHGVGDGEGDGDGTEST